MTDLTTITPLEATSKYIAGSIYGTKNFSSAKSLVGTAKTFGKISRGLGVANIVLTGIEAFTDPNGPQLHHGIDAIVGVASIACPLFGAVWCVLDIGSEIFTHESISEHIQDAIDGN